MFPYRRPFVMKTFCYGDILLRRRSVWRRLVEETLCKETFCVLFTTVSAQRSSQLDPVFDNNDALSVLSLTPLMRN